MNFASYCVNKICFGHSVFKIFNCEIHVRKHENSIAIAMNDEESFIDPSSSTCHMPFLIKSD